MASPVDPGPSTLSHRGFRWIQIFGRLKRGASYNLAAESLMPALLQDHNLDAGRAQRTGMLKALRDATAAIWYAMGCYRLQRSG